MNPVRLSIAGTLAVVAAIGLGIAALRFATLEWSIAMELITKALLMASILGAIWGRDVGWWRGVAIFGWGYLMLDAVPWAGGLHGPQTQVSSLLSKLYPIVYHDPPLEPAGFGFGGMGGMGFGGGGSAGSPLGSAPPAPAAPRPVMMRGDAFNSFLSVGIWLCRLLFALVGGIVGRLLLPGAAVRSGTPEDSPKGDPPAR